MRPITIWMTGNSAGAQTLSVANPGNTATVVLGGNDGSAATLSLNQAGASLTIGAGVTVETGATGPNGGSATIGDDNDSITNQGRFLANDLNRVMTLDGDHINDVGGVWQADTNGVLTIGNSVGDVWDNNGSIVINGGVVNLGGSFDTAAIGTVQRNGGALNITGTMNNVGATFLVNADTDGLGAGDSGTGNVTLAGAGRINGGTIQSDGVATMAALTGATLDGVTLDVNLSVGTGTLIVLNGLKLSNGRTLAINPAAFQTGTLSFNSAGAQTLSVANPGNTATVVLGGNDGTAASLSLSQAGASLTIGAGVTVETGATGPNGGSATIGDDNDSITNQGIITADDALRNMGVRGTFINQGTVQALNGSDVNADFVSGVTLQTTVTNNVAGVLTGGSWKAVGNGSVLSMNGTAISQNAADITLDGAGSIIRVRDGTSVAFTNFEASLTTNQATGALRVLGNRGYTTANAFSNAGVLQLGGGTFDAGSLTNTATGSIFGFGTLSDVVVNSGVVRAAGGVLTAQAGIDGQSGTIQIGAGGTLVLGANSDADFLVHNGTTAGSLSLGTSNVVVSVDYTNANFGVGNGFNGRANVSGTGQIQAAGDVNQAIMGQVTNGGTASAVLDLGGNIHVGDVVTKTFQIAATGATGPSLRGALQTTGGGALISDARLSGSGVTAQNYGPIGPGASTGNFEVTYTGTPPGALAANQRINVVNNFDDVQDQAILIANGAVFRFAAPVINTAQPIAFGNRHVGDVVVAQGVSITNNVANDGFSERLDAATGATTGGVIVAGSIADLNAGATSADGITVSMNTGTADNKAGSATINFTSDGAGTSNLGLTALASQQVQVTGQVFRFANPVVNNGTVNFGDRHVGGATSQTVNITNNVANDGFSERLDAAVVGATGAATSNNGSFGLLNAGANNNAAITVGIDTTTRGAKSGSVEIDFDSNGSGTSGLGITDLANQNVTVSGNVYALANPTVTLQLEFGTLTIGQNDNRAITVQNVGGLGDLFQEGLDASWSLAGLPNFLNLNGSINNLLSGQINLASMSVDLNSALAGLGAIDQIVQVMLASDGGAVGNSLGLTSLTTANVRILANIVNLVGGVADPDVPTTAFDFGQAHVGDVVAQQTVRVENDAVAPADGLNAAFTGAINGATTNGGTITGLAAGGFNDTAMAVGISTAAAGAINGAATIGFTSDGTQSGAVQGVGSQQVTVTGQVFALADGQVADSTLELADVHVGDAANAVVQVSNVAAATGGFTESLDATLTGVTGGVGSGTVDNLAVGGSSSNLSIAVDTSTAGARVAGATVDFKSDGAGINSLGVTDIANDTVTASVDVFALAAGDVTNPIQNLGQVHVGGSATAFLGVQNTATGPAGFVENLDATFTNVVGGTGNGSIDGLASGALSGALSLVVDTSVAGNRQATAPVDFKSDGTGINTLGVTDIANENVSASVAVFQLAAGDASSPVAAGNVHVGQTLAGSINVTNTASGPAGFVENLDAAVTLTGGNTTGTSGSVNNLAAGQTSVGAMTVTLDSSTAGAKSGTATIGFTSDGAGINSLGHTAVGSETVTVTGGVFALANANVAQTIDFGTLTIGATSQLGLSIANQLSVALNLAGFQEDLDASWSQIGVPGGLTLAGSIANLNANGLDTGSMTVSLNTAGLAAGGFEFFADVLLASDGGDTSGLGTTQLTTRQVRIVANLVAAAGDVALAFVPDTAKDFGQMHVGDNPTAQTAEVRNNATPPADGLDAAFTGSSAGIIAQGTIDGLAAGGADTTSMTVDVSTATAGAINGTATIGFTSDGTESGAVQGVGSQAIAVTGEVFAFADPTLSATTLNLGAARVGDAAPTQTLTIGNDGTAGDLFQENLDAVFGVAPANYAVNGGNVDNLAAGASADRQIALLTGTAGDFSGAILGVDLTSTGDGINGLGDTGLGGQSVTLNGKVYAPAVADVQTPTIDLGTVHVGDDVSARAITVANIAGGALADMLRGAFGAVDGPFVGLGSLGDVAAGGSSSGLSIDASTANAGVFTGSAAINLLSHNDDMADLGLPTELVSLSLTVNNFAKADYDKLGGNGAFSGGGTSFLLDFGTINLGLGVNLATDLALFNAAVDPADLLDGTFDLSGLGVFGALGFNTFQDMAAGFSFSPLVINFDSLGLGVGLYEGTITLLAKSQMGQDLFDLASVSLAVRARIVDGGTQVPEPSILLLLAGGFLMVVVTA